MSARTLVIAAVILATFAAPATSVQASTIGPTDDWVPLSQGVQQGWLSAAYADKILHAGLDATCEGHVYKLPDGSDFDNGGTGNGWLLGNKTGLFYTNAHWLIDKYGNPKTPFDQCYVETFTDVERAHSYSANAYYVDPNSSDFRTASLRPLGSANEIPQDRAVVPFLRPIPGGVSLAVNLAVAEKLKGGVLEKGPEFVVSVPGDEVIMVSRRPSIMRTGVSDFEPMIQRCHVMVKTYSLVGDSPWVILTDCDNLEGDSGALYFVPDPTKPGDLIPVAMTSSNAESGENQPWGLHNTDAAIVLDENFFKFDSGFGLSDLLHLGN